jgi:hypothetical protein
LGRKPGALPPVHQLPQLHRACGGADIRRRAVPARYAPGGRIDGCGRRGPVAAAIRGVLRAGAQAAIPRAGLRPPGAFRRNQQPSRCGWSTISMRRRPGGLPRTNCWPVTAKAASPPQHPPARRHGAGHGTAIPDGHSVWMAGHAVPVDGKGDFVAEEILPEGLHTVEVAVLDPFGNGELFLRDLALEKERLVHRGDRRPDPVGPPDQRAGPPACARQAAIQRRHERAGRLAFYSSGNFKTAGR